MKWGDDFISSRTDIALWYIQTALKFGCTNRTTKHLDHSSTHTSSWFTSLLMKLCICFYYLPRTACHSLKLKVSSHISFSQWSHQFLGSIQYTPFQAWVDPSKPTK